MLEVEASRFADSACPAVCASFSFVRRLSSSRSFWFRLALLEDIRGFNRRMPADRLMRSVLVVGAAQQIERRLYFGFVPDVEGTQKLSDVPPILSSSPIWSPIPQREEIGREEAV